MSTELPSVASGVGHPPTDYGPAGARRGILRPPFVYAASILTGVLLHIGWPLSFVQHALGRPIGGALALAAVVLFVGAVRQLWTAGTPVPGSRATTVLVRTGPYRVSRNPIYLAFSLLHLGVAAWLGRLKIVGCSQVTLDTTAPLARAIRFYERHGYVRSNAVSDFFGMALYEYRKAV